MINQSESENPNILDGFTYMNGGEVYSRVMKTVAGLEFTGISVSRSMVLLMRGCLFMETYTALTVTDMACGLGNRGN